MWGMNRLNRRTLLSLATAAAGTAVLAACGADGSDRGTGGAGGATDGATGGGAGNGARPAENQLAAVQEAGVLRIGLEGNYRPYSYHDETGALVGMEVEIGRELAAGLGVEPEFIETKWDSLIAGMDVNKYDIVINNIAPTPERAEVYAFTVPYIRTIGRVAVAEDSDLQTLADLEGARAAQTATSNFAGAMEELGAEIVPVGGFAEAVELLATGRADATANDYVSFDTYRKEQPDAAFRLLDEELPDQSDSVVLLHQDQEELQTRLDEIIATLSEDGTLSGIFEEYVGLDLTPQG
jgi:L-cystine transport system substrate-binding protein